MTPTGQGQGQIKKGGAAESAHGALRDIVRVEPRRVIKLGLFFGVLILLPLFLLLVAQHQIEDSPDQNMQWLSKGIGLAVLVGGIVIAMAIVLAYAVAWQQSLASTLQRAVNRLPLQFAYIDSDRRYRFSNRSYMEICANPERDWIGRPVREVLDDDTYARIEPHLDQAMAGQQVDFELRLSDQKGPLDLSVSYLPDVNPQGGISGVFVFAEDITLRKQAERRDKEQVLEFAHLSRLASIGEVAAEIAHQINQPLAAIAMFSNAAARSMKGGGDLSQVPAWLDTINAQSKRASEVVGSLRRFVRPATMEAVVLDLNVPLGEVVALLEHDASVRHVSLNLELADLLPPVMASEILIEQVVFSLARNAILAAADVDKQGQVTIRSRSDSARVWIEIEGSRPTRKDAADASCCATDCMPAEPGVGYSLTISRSIVEGFGGEVGCHCNESNGIFCYFNLPRCKT